MHVRYRKIIPSLIVVSILILIVLLPQLMVRSNHKYSYNDQNQLSQQFENQPSTALVFGGGIRNNRPMPVLEQRLLAAKTLYDRGLVNKIIVTGDASSPSYNEPQAMSDYLVSKGVLARDIVQDRAGFSTYESCERARKVYNLNQAVAVTQVGHLDRAIFLCRSFGIETFGYAAERAGNRTRTPQIVREMLGNFKAVFNVYVIGEQTFLGDANEVGST